MFQGARRARPPRTGRETGQSEGNPKSSREPGAQRLGQQGPCRLLPAPLDAGKQQGWPRVPRGTGRSQESRPSRSISQRAEKASPKSARRSAERWLSRRPAERKGNGDWGTRRVRGRRGTQSARRSAGPRPHGAGGAPGTRPALGGGLRSELRVLPPPATRSPCGGTHEPRHGARHTAPQAPAFPDQRHRGERGKPEAAREADCDAEAVPTHIPRRGSQTPEPGGGTWSSRGPHTAVT